MLTEKEVNDILSSEEARIHGEPYKLQIWEELRNPEKEVEVLEVKKGLVDYKFIPNGALVHQEIGSFIKEFKFKRTIYQAHSSKRGR